MTGQDVHSANFADFCDALFMVMEGQVASRSTLSRP
jgi:hypothetical protein